MCAEVIDLGFSRLAMSREVNQARIGIAATKSSMKPVLFAATVFCLAVAAGCAVQLDSGAEKVRIVSADEKVRCEPLGIVSADQQLGLNKASNSMNRAVNEVARRGGNGIFIVSAGTSGIDGQSVTAEALRCKP